MRGRFLWTGAAIVLLGAAAAGLAPLVARGGGLPGASSVATYAVTRGRFARRATAEGYLKAVKATPIAVPARNVRSGFKIAWIAEDGARVRAGDVVVEFDPTDMEKSLVDNRGDRTSAVRRADKARAAAEASRTGLTEEARVAREEHEHAKRFASADETIFSRNEIISSTIDRDLAEKKASHAEWKIGSTGKQASVELEIERLKASAAEILIKQAVEGLAALRVAAPHDGILVLERNWRGETPRVGDSVWPSQKLAEIPELETMEAKVYVLEADASGLAPGRRAEVTLAARPGVVVPGEVSRVDTLAKPLHEDVPVQYFETILSLDPPAGARLKPGQRVTARILLDESEGALSVPRQAVFEKDGRRIVYRVEGGRAEPVEVKVARFGLGTVMIEDGLSEGDHVALRDPTLAASDIFSSSGAREGGRKAP